MMRIDIHRCAPNAQLSVCHRLHIRQVTTPPLDTSTQSISISKVPEFAPRTQNTKQYSLQPTKHGHTCRLVHAFRAVDLKENATGVKFCFKLGKTASATWMSRPDIRQRPTAVFCGKATHVRFSTENNLVHLCSSRPKG